MVLRRRPECMTVHGNVVHITAMAKWTAQTWLFTSCSQDKEVHSEFNGEYTTGFTDDTTSSTYYKEELQITLIHINIYKSQLLCLPKQMQYIVRDAKKIDLTWFLSKLLVNTVSQNILYIKKLSKKAPTIDTYKNFSSDYTSIKTSVTALNV